MVNREEIKAAIDEVQDEHLDMLFRIIRVFRVATPSPRPQLHENEPENWQRFVDATAGAWQGEPLERGDQGEYEQRETLR